MKVLLDKGANRLARNKKGRKPGDVFSPTVEDDKKERIKNMLGMGTQEAAASATAVAPAATTAAAASAAAAVTAAAAPSTTASADGGAEATRGTAFAAGGNGSLAGGSTYSGDVSASTLAAAAVPPPAYKVGTDLCCRNPGHVRARGRCACGAHFCA